MMRTKHSDHDKYYHTLHLPISKITTLKHKVGNHTVKDRSLIMKGFPLLPNTLLTSAESTKVLGSFGYNIAEQTKDDASTLASSDFNIEEDFVCDLGTVAVIFVEKCKQLACESTVIVSQSTEQPDYSRRTFQRHTYPLAVDP